MTFVLMVVAYIVRRNLDSADRLDPDAFWRRYFRFGGRGRPGKEKRLWPAVLVVLVPSIVLIITSYGLRESSWSAMVYPFHLLLLILLLGTPGWHQSLTEYSGAWQRGDMQAAWHRVNARLTARERGQASAPADLHLVVSNRFMTAVFERYFLIMFWYVVGGIGVAFLVRAIVALREHWPQAAARPSFALAVQVLAWVPVRLLAFSFGLAGDLVGWLRQAGTYLFSPTSKTDEVLMAAANSALTGYALDPVGFARVQPDGWLNFGKQSLTAIRDLLNRSMLVWICVWALLVIAGLLD